MIADILANKENNFVIENKDIVIKKGEGAKLIALKNYLKRNKKYILGLKEDGLQVLILGKCLELELDINGLKYNIEEIKLGIINITLVVQTEGAIMPLNKTQIGILDLTTTDLEVDCSQATKELIKNISLKLGIELNQDVDSNIYMLTEAFMKEIIKGRLMFLSFLDNINSFFDTNKFEGYSAGNYIGLRSALLELGIFKDCKIGIEKPGIINIILLAKEGVKIEEQKEEIAKRIHKYIAIGIKTFEDKEKPGLITNKVNASNGQEIEYGFYIAKQRKFNIKITYYLDYEDSNMIYDIVEVVRQKTKEILEYKYKNIGKDVRVQDFYSMVIKIAGLGRVSVEFIELNEKEEEIKRYKDEDIKIDTKEIFVLNKIEIQGGKDGIDK